MAAAMGIGAGSPPSSSVFMRRSLNKNQKRNCATRVSFVSASATAVADPYNILRIHRGASESEVKQAFRRLALKYHPDVCKRDDATVKFNQIYEAYDVVMSELREGSKEEEEVEPDYDPWDEEEGWLGYEAAWHPNLNTTNYSYI